MKPRNVLVRGTLVKLSFEIIDRNDPKHEQEEEHDDDDVENIFQSNRDRLNCDFEILIYRHRSERSQ